MVMNKLVVCRMVIGISGILAVLTAAPTFAAESHFYAATHGLSASFYVIGGRYDIYVYAKRPVAGPYAPESRGCIFGGNLQRVWPTHDAMSLGSGITVSTIVPHKIGPGTITVPAGLYAIYISALTTCDWKFVLNSSSEDPAGITPVTMFKAPPANKEVARIGILGDHIRFNPLDPAVSASLNESVRFYAQFRTDHDKREMASGTMQIIHDGKIVSTAPLKYVTDEQSATVFIADVTWEPSDAKYLGKNTVKFIVTIGSAEFTSDGEFTLTQ
jgi:hypothetical protein